MKRIAGTFVLLAGLGGCVSFTAQPGTAEKKTTDARGNAAPAPNYAVAQASGILAGNPAWGQQQPDQSGANTASRMPTTYAPQPTPVPGAYPVQQPPMRTAAVPPQAAVPRPVSSPNGVATTLPAQPTGNARPPAPLSLPDGMPMAVTPPSERERQVSYTPNQASQEQVVNAARFEPKVPPRPVPAVQSPTTPEPRTAAAANTTPVTPGVPGKGGMPLMRLVNTKRITLNFEVKDVGPSGLSSVELWYTQDCREWKKYDAPTQAQAYVIEVDEEGMYGFTLLAKSGIGLGKEPPQAGEQPQVWVIVDLSKPDVQLTEVTPASVGRVPQVTLGWRASDKNLGRQPISLYYAEKEEGPWKVVAANLENTGKYVWQAPQGIARVHFKVEATDLAGNVGRGMTTKPVLLDNSMPTVSITNVDSAPTN